MPGQFERRAHGNKLVSLQLIRDQILFAPIGDIDITAVWTESDAFGQCADFGLEVHRHKIGQWPRAVAWSRDGKTVLAQSLVDNALAIVSFDGKNLNVTGQLKVAGGPDGIRTAGR